MSPEEKIILSWLADRSQPLDSRAKQMIVINFKPLFGGECYTAIDLSEGFGGG